MKTNDIKKGMTCYLRNGWRATMMDNRKGNIRCMKVEGFETETGDCYAHDILWVLVDNKRVAVEHTPAQLSLRAFVRAAGG